MVHGTRNDKQGEFRLVWGGEYMPTYKHMTLQ